MKITLQQRNVFAGVATYAKIPPAVAIPLMKNAHDGLLLPYVDFSGLEYQLAWKNAVTKKIHASHDKEILSGNQLSNTEMESFWISIVKKSNLTEHKNPEVINIVTYFSQDPKRASSIELSINKEVLKNNISTELQDKLVIWASQVFEMINGVNGYITQDYVSANPFGSMSPYEIFLGIDYPWSSINFKTKSRGYYWGNYLSKQHIDLLGGEAELMKAPVFSFQKIGETGYYLQLSDELNTLVKQVDKLHKLKSYLEPILPENSIKIPVLHEDLPDLLL